MSPEGSVVEQAQAAPAAQQPSEARPAAKAPRNLRGFLSLEDFERAARRYLPRMLHGFISGAVETDASLRDNRDAFAEWGFVPRVLVDTSAAAR
jgi:L-lactate dehydrogenase (cytochrome)